MKNKLIYKITKSIKLMVIAVGYMWIGSSIQLYSIVLSQSDSLKEYSIWYKIFGFALFFNVKEYKGTICETLGNITLVTLLLLLLILLTSAFIKIRKLYSKNKSEHISE